MNTMSPAYTGVYFYLIYWCLSDWVFWSWCQGFYVEIAYKRHLVFFSLGWPKFECTFEFQIKLQFLLIKLSVVSVLTVKNFRTRLIWLMLLKEVPRREIICFLTFVLSMKHLLALCSLFNKFLFFFIFMIKLILIAELIIFINNWWWYLL